MTVHNETETGYGVTGPLTWASGKASVLAGGGYEVLPEQWPVVACLGAVLWNSNLCSWWLQMLYGAKRNSPWKLINLLVIFLFFGTQGNCPKAGGTNSVINAFPCTPGPLYLSPSFSFIDSLPFTPVFLHPHLPALASGSVLVSLHCFLVRACACRTLSSCLLVQEGTGEGRPLILSEGPGGWGGPKCTSTLPACFIYLVTAHKPWFSIPDFPVTSDGWVSWPHRGQVPSFICKDCFIITNSQIIVKVKLGIKSKIYPVSNKT